MCFTTADKGYMRLKAETFRKAAQPTRQVQQLDRIVQNYKPVSNHKHNVSFFASILYASCWHFVVLNSSHSLAFDSFQIEYEEKKKAEGKKARDDKDSVLEMMFAAFEKHQYYNIKDLVRITKQPVVSNLKFKMWNQIKLFL